MDVSNWRIVILGKTAAGKSSLANTIFGGKLFTTNTTAKSETSKCQAETKLVSGRSITLIDTPGLFDTDTSEEELKTHLIRCVTECAPGPHAFLIVLQVEKFTEQEQAVITKISQCFSEEVFKYATVLFTHGDELDEGQTIEDYFHQNQLASDLLKKCGGRCHVIDNKYWRNNQQDEYRSNQFQVNELLKTIDKIIESNKGSCYTNEMLQAVEKGIQKEEELIRQSLGNMTREEVRKQAKDRSSIKFMFKLVGITTGVLLGPLFGGVPLVGQVLLMLKKNLSGLGPLKSFANIAVKAAAVIGVVGAAAVGGVAGGAVVAVGVIAAVVAVAGAVKGGVAGYHAAEGAATAREAAQRAAEAVKNQALSAFKRPRSKDETECKPLMSE